MLEPGRSIARFSSNCVLVSRGFRQIPVGGAFETVALSDSVACPRESVADTPGEEADSEAFAAIIRNTSAPQAGTRICTARLGRKSLSGLEYSVFPIISDPYPLPSVQVAGLVSRPLF
jgi:hypothetical protein